MGGFFWRLYRVRALSALVLSLPALLLCLWCAWSAFARFDEYRRAADARVSLDLEQFHIQLFDLLRRDLAKTFMSPPPDRSRIDRFSFRISSRSMDALLHGGELEENRPYVPAALDRGGVLQPLELRLRGQRHWNLLPKKKSIKVRLPRGALLDGHRVFNLINDPTPMIVGEPLILDLAREMGVLTPNANFVRARINGADLGVYHYETQPDESLLRVNRRMPGSMYSGDLPSRAGTEELWSDVSRWKKVAWRSENEQREYSDLKGLLSRIRSATVADFARFARRRIDLKAFAAFEAVDVAFGGDQHDFRENHKLYFDPYRGRWEPVAWDFRGFRHHPYFNDVENPVLLRLKLVPEYISLRNALLYDFLMGEGSASSVRARGARMLKKLAPELATDPNWLAYQLLSGVDRFHRQMLRPMNLERAALVFESELTTYRRRRDFLVRELQNNPLWIRVNGERAGSALPVQLILDGITGVELTGFRARWPADCECIQWRVLRDGVPISDYSADDQVRLQRPLSLFPALRMVKRKDPSAASGTVRSESIPEAYSFSIESACAPLRLEAEGLQMATGSVVRSRPAPPGQLARLAQDRLAADQIPSFVAGEVSPRPWQLWPPAEQKVAIGPGEVSVDQTRIFEEWQAVEVAPGTRFSMAPGASLVFLGPVTVNGTKDRPVLVESLAGGAWGGIAVQGPATRGSSFRYLVATGGTRPERLDAFYPGMINIHDTKEISLSDCRFGGNDLSDDVLHAAYVEGLTVEDTRVEGAYRDAMDLEFTRAELKRVTVARAGDDGLDLMGSRVRLRDSAIADCKGNGISSGEETALVVRDSLVASCKVALLVKNASQADLFGSLFFDNKTGVEVYSREVRFEGDSRVNADTLFAVQSKRAVKRKDRKRDNLNQGRVYGRFPHQGTLDHLLQDVLGLSGWDQLPAWLQSLREKPAPSCATAASTASQGEKPTGGIDADRSGAKSAPQGGIDP